MVDSANATIFAAPRLNAVASLLAESEELIVALCDTTTLAYCDDQEENEPQVKFC